MLGFEPACDSEKCAFTGTRRPKHERKTAGFGTEANVFEDFDIAGWSFKIFNDVL